MANNKSREEKWQIAGTPPQGAWIPYKFAVGNNNEDIVPENVKKLPEDRNTIWCSGCRRMHDPAVCRGPPSNKGCMVHCGICGYLHCIDECIYLTPERYFRTVVVARQGLTPFATRKEVPLGMFNVGQLEEIAFQAPLTTEESKSRWSREWAETRTPRFKIRNARFKTFDYSTVTVPYVGDFLRRGPATVPTNLPTNRPVYCPEPTAFAQRSMIRAFDPRHEWTFPFNSRQEALARNIGWGAAWVTVRDATVPGVAPQVVPPPAAVVPPRVVTSPPGEEDLIWFPSEEEEDLILFD